jgi:uncharacterized membrane protein
MDDLRTVFHLPINDAAKKVRKKRHALAHPRQKEQKQQEQNERENFFCLGFFGGALIWVPFTVCFFCSETDLGAFHSKLTTLIIVLCLSSK